MELFAKVFLGDGPKHCMGPGRIHLLKMVREFGSLRRAAQEMGISYRWAWGHINAAGKELGYPLLNRIEEGKTGRPSKLTDEALAMIDWYDRVEKKLMKTLREANKSMPRFLMDDSNRSTPPSTPPGA